MVLAKEQLVNFENYFEFQELAKTGTQTIYTKDVNKSNIDRYIKGLLNIFRDAIETEDCVHEMFVHLVYADGIECDLHVFDLLFNMMLWRLWTDVDAPIDSESLFFEENLTKRNIKAFCDKGFVKKYRNKLNFIRFNNILDEAMHYYMYLNDFSFYLSDTICAEDTRELMNADEEFKSLLTPDFSNVSFEEIKNEGLNYSRRQIELIKKNNHCLAESFNANEAINPKQFKEVNCDIGTKPNGEGGVFPVHINRSFINGGLDKPEYYYVESATGRQAQILSKTNVAISGEFARYLGTNNIDTIFHPDENYFCDTKHLLRIKIENGEVLDEYNLRFYKESLMDDEFKVVDSDVDLHLIGQTLYFYSPATCASLTRGEGLCRRCYGNLYFVNRDINPGKLASDLLSSRYTQTLLSAKHLLESAVIALVWIKDFFDYFNIEFNAVTLKEEFDYSGYSIKIDSSNIDFDTEDESDMEQYTESITKFSIVTPDGDELDIHTKSFDDMYLSKDINTFIREYTENSFSEDDEKIIIIDLNLFKQIYGDTGVLFLIRIQNNELSATLEKAKAIINKNSETSKYDIHSITSEFIRVNNDGGIHLNATHYEVIIANQIRLCSNILERPDWSKLQEPEYNIIALSKALSNNPSVTVCLEYKRISDTLYKPLTFKKDKPSFLDLYFMKSPQKYINNPDIISDDPNYKPEGEINIIEPFEIDETLINSKPGMMSFDYDRDDEKTYEESIEE